MVSPEFKKIEQLFLNAEIEDARHKTQILFSHFMPQRTADANAFAALEQAAQKIAGGYPLQYALGEWVFLDFTVKIGEGVLIPREETAALLYAARPLLKSRPNASITELCAGSGVLCIACAREFPLARITAVEKYPLAMEYLKSNLSSLAPGVRPILADLFGYEKQLADNSLDLLLCNPPYVSESEYKSLSTEVLFEPATALTDNFDGLSFYRYIAREYHRCLNSSGMLVFEAGDGRSDEVAQILRQNAYTDIRILPDDFGLPRAVSGVRE